MLDLSNAPVEDGCRVLRAVPFAAPFGHRPLELDLYRGSTRSTNPGPLPLVVCLHGGGWAVGSRTSFGATYDSFFATVARAGYVVASLDYRLSGEAVFPAQLDDVLAGLAWLASHGDALGADPGRTVVWGESAGGHLASLAALTAGGPLRIAGVVAWYAPSDLTTMGGQARPDAVARADDPDSREARLLGVPVQDAGPLAVAASPVAHVHAGAPPFLLVHGDTDRFVPVDQSRQLHAALQAAGVESRLELVPGSDHMWRGAPDVDELLAFSLEFVADVTSR